MKTIKQNQTVAGYKLANGMHVYVQGFIFEVQDVQIQSDNGRDVVRFAGKCTEDVRNDSIRETAYNGGRYGQLADMSYTLATSSPLYSNPSFNTEAPKGY